MNHIKAFARAFLFSNLFTFVFIVGTTVHAVTTVKILYPEPQQEVFGPTKIFAKTSGDTSAVAQVKFSYGTQQLGSVTAPPYQVIWNAQGSGPATISAEALDRSNNRLAHWELTVFIATGPVPVVCNTVILRVMNKTTQTITGTIFPQNSTLAVGNYSAPAGQISEGLFAITPMPNAMSYPFRIDATYQGQTARGFCSGSAPIVNACPKLGVDDVITLAPGTAGSASPVCTIQSR